MFETRQMEGWRLLSGQRSKNGDVFFFFFPFLFHFSLFTFSQMRTKQLSISRQQWLPTRDNTKRPVGKMLDRVPDNQEQGPDRNHNNYNHNHHQCSVETVETPAPRQIIALLLSCERPVPSNCRL